MKSNLRKVFGPALLFFMPSLSIADGSDEPTFWQDIRPIFHKHCTICHSMKNIAKKDIGGGLALTTFDTTMKDPIEPVVVPGKTAESKLYELITTKDDERRMPKDADPLPDSDIELVRRWIDGGAKEGERPAQVAAEATAPASPKRPKSLVRTFDIVLGTSATMAGGTATDPPTQPARLELALRIGPLPPVTALSYNPNGKWLCVGSYGSVAIWDLADARLVTSFEVPGAVHSVAFNTEGSRLAVAGGLPARGGQVVIFDTASWQSTTTLDEHTDVVYDVAFSPDGQTLATASLDKTIRVWSMAEGRCLQTLKGHSDFVYSVAFTPDGKRLLSSSKDRSIKIYSTETWQPERTLAGHNEDVLTISVSPDSLHVVSAGREPQLKWWIIENGQNNRNMSGHSGTVNELVFSDDGKRIASVGQDKHVRIWDGADGKSLRSIAGASEWLYSVALSPDARFVAAGSWDGLVRLWETETGRRLATLITPPSPDPAEPQWIALTPEGYYAAAEELASIARWQMAGQPVTGEILSSTLEQSEKVREALRGIVVETVKIPDEE